MSILLLDSAVPKQPLITLSWELRPVSRGCYYNIRASVREVVSTRSSWAYRQHTWSLGDGTLRARPSENDVREYALTYHLEIDWAMARCWILVQDRLQELCLESSCGGASPTADELRLQLSPGTTASLSELLLG